MSRVLTVPLRDIAVGKRLRDIDPDYVDLMVQSLQDHAPRDPLPPMTCAKRGQKYKLVAGGHRHAAYKKAGQEEVRIELIEGNDLELKLIEIDENLCRRELSELDRATFLSERQSVWEELHPETRHGGDRKSDSFKSTTLATRFSAETAEKLRLSERSVQRAVARHRKIDAEVRDQIKFTWIADSGVNLDALSRLAPGEQKRVVKLLLKEKEPASSVGAALKQLRGIKQDDTNPALARLLNTWRGADAATRTAFLQHLDELGEIEAWQKKRRPS